MSDRLQKTLQEMSGRKPLWLDASKREGDEVIVSTTASLTRNLHGYNFPLNSNEAELDEVLDRVWSACATVEELSESNMVPLQELSWEDRRLLLERQLISSAMVEIDRPAGVAIGSGEYFSMMINDDDHIRMQQVEAGLVPEETWSFLEDVDEGLGRQLPYAYKEPFVFLTASPTNVGTGLRVSIIVHLPALVLTNEVETVLRHATQYGVQVRGIHGEGSSVYGNLFQISNQLTLGRSEGDIVKSLVRVATLLTDHEIEARSTLWLQARLQLEDKIHRSIGLLRTARILAISECMNLLSAARLGVNMEVLTGVETSRLDELMILTQPSHLDRREGQVLDPSERDILRAELVRTRIDVTGGKGS